MPSGWIVSDKTERPNAMSRNETERQPSGYTKPNMTERHDKTTFDAPSSSGVLRYDVTK